MRQKREERKSELGIVAAGLTVNGEVGVMRRVHHRDTESTSLFLSFLGALCALCGVEVNVRCTSVIGRGRTRMTHIKKKKIRKRSGVHLRRP